MSIALASDCACQQIRGFSQITEKTQLAQKFGVQECLCGDLLACRENGDGNG
jgi:hypothetical protein